MIGTFRERPCIRNNDEDMILRGRRGIGHETMVQESNHFPCAAEQSIRLEVGILPLGHLLT
jgi:hypothetical protein